MGRRNIFLVMDITWCSEEKPVCVALSFKQASKFCLNHDGWYQIYLVKENDTIVQSYENLVACYKDKKPCSPQDLDDSYWAFSELPPKWKLKGV